MGLAKKKVDAKSFNLLFILDVIVIKKVILILSAIRNNYITKPWKFGYVSVDVE